jgi:hypothetical protein
MVFPSKRSANRRQADFSSEEQNLPPAIQKAIISAVQEAVTTASSPPGLTEAISALTQVATNLIKMQTQSNKSTEIPSVNMATIRLPQWSQDDPDTWFLQARAQFSSKGINSQKVMYDNVLAVIPPNVIARVNAFVSSNTEEATRFDDFQATILTSLHLSRAERYANFLALTLGDKTPMELLARMYSLFPDQVQNPSEFFRQAFINKMPGIIQESLTVKDDLDMSALAGFSAKMVGSLRAKPMMIQRTHYPRKEDKQYRDSQRSGSIANNGLCYYHNQYGKEAWKCQEPCDWPTKPAENAEGNQQ